MAPRNLLLKLATLSLLALCSLADERVQSCSGSRCALRPRAAVRRELKSSAYGAPTEHAQLMMRKPELARTLQLQGGSKMNSELIGQLKVFAAFAVWYLMSIFYSLLNKQVLMVWNFPCASATLQLLVGALWTLLLWLPLPVPGQPQPLRLRAPPILSKEEIIKLGSVSLFLALGHLLSTVAPAYGTVAFTNVVKTLEPLFTCAFSAIFFGQTFSAAVYLSLLPVIAGVVLATANEVSFSAISLISGLLSNVMFAMRAISAKSVMQKPLGSNLNAQNLYGVLTLQALVLCLPFALVFEGGAIVKGTADAIAEVGGLKFLRMLLYLGLSHYMYNECAFLALSSVHPVTHAVANTVKRVAVIIISVLYFRNPLTKTGAAGSAIAIAGVMVYSLAKAQWEQAQKVQAQKAQEAPVLAAPVQAAQALEAQEAQEAQEAPAEEAETLEAASAEAA